MKTLILKFLFFQKQNLWVERIKKLLQTSTRFPIDCHHLLVHSFECSFTQSHISEDIYTRRDILMTYSLTPSSLWDSVPSICHLQQQLTHQDCLSKHSTTPTSQSDLPRATLGSVTVWAVIWTAVSEFVQHSNKSSVRCSTLSITTIGNVTDSSFKSLRLLRRGLSTGRRLMWTAWQTYPLLHSASSPSLCQNGLTTPTNMDSDINSRTNLSVFCSTTLQESVERQMAVTTNLQMPRGNWLPLQLITPAQLLPVGDHQTLVAEFVSSITLHDTWMKTWRRV